MSSSEHALIDLDGIDVEIDGNPILHDLRWRLEPGQHWGVVGANGSGKSTFLAVLSGARWPVPGRGRRTYDFGRGLERDAIAARRKITLVGHELQDRYTRLQWNFKAIDVVLSGVFRMDVPRRQAVPAETEQARAILRDLDLLHLADRRFLELSRGEQRRVLIARSLAFGPRVLLLDEPASGLDTAARRGLEAMLNRVAEHAQLVMTAHAVEHLPNVVTHIAEIAGGRVVASGPAADFRSAAHGAFAVAAPKPGPAAGTDAAVENDAATVANGAVAAIENDVVAAENDVVVAAENGARAPGRAPTSSAAASRDPEAALIDVRSADVWLGGRRVLHRIDWRLHDGEHWLVTGPNGAGKSSFLRLLHGQLRPARGGEIHWPALGDPANIWALRRRVAWVSPELQAGYRYRATARDCVASGFDSSLGLVRALRTEERDRVELLLERFDLTKLAARLLTELSYGQFRRVLLARALVHRPRVLLLDEPWEGLDRSTGALLARRLDECVAEGTHLVCASHLPIHLSRYTHELTLSQGNIRSAHRRKPCTPYRPTPKA